MTASLQSTISPVVDGKIWPSVPPQATLPPQSHLITRAAKSVARLVYGVIDAGSHIAYDSDGVDKSLKFVNGLAVAMMAANRSAPYWSGLNDIASFVDRLFSGVAFFGRLNAVVEVRNGENFAGRLKRDYLKTTAVLFQAISKTFEFMRLLQSLSLLSVEWFAKMDALYLGGVAARIGNASVVGKVAYQVGFGGCKNFFLFIACVYSVVNSVLVLADWKANAHTLATAALSIGADVGKMTLILMVFTVSYTWAAVAIGTAICSLTKIVLRNYPQLNKPNAVWPAIEYPQWMKA